MTIEEAQRLAFDPRDVNRPTLVEALDVLARRLDQVEAHALERDRLRILGGLS